MEAENGLETRPDQDVVYSFACSASVRSSKSRQTLPAPRFEEGEDWQVIAWIDAAKANPPTKAAGTGESSTVERSVDFDMVVQVRCSSCPTPSASVKFIKISTKQSLDQLKD